jgi:hypothetical protein
MRHQPIKVENTELKQSPVRAKADISYRAKDEDPLQLVNI